MGLSIIILPDKNTQISDTKVVSCLCGNVFLSLINVYSNIREYFVYILSLELTICTYKIYIKNVHSFFLYVSAVDRHLWGATHKTYMI